MPKFHTLPVKEVRRETPDCVSIAFDVPPALAGEYQYVHGQNLAIKATIGGEEIRRSYSICASPLDGELRVAVKKLPGGKFSTYANEQLRAGDELEVMTPSGNFSVALDPANRKSYAAFAAGSGITPIISILKTVLRTEPQSDFTLFYGNRTVDHIIFREELEALKNKYLGRLSIHYVLSREHPGADLFYGRIDGQRCGDFCRLLLDPQDVDAYFLCGPEEMIFSVRDKLEQLGVPPKAIHFELFTTPAGPQGLKTQTPETPAKAVQSRVEVTLDGAAFVFELDSRGDTILDGALKAGADLPFACKGGVCATCRAKVMAGEVEMKVNYGLSADEVADGYVLTCQATPVSEGVALSYDV
jgi:ring-1,2-phenylacetyl-CoA epoxidase subunit PaaE